MNLVNENGMPINGNPKKIVTHEAAAIVDASGEEISTQPETPMTTAEVGKALSTHMLNGALKFPTNDLVNKQFDILYHAALNILCHRITNIGAGFEAGNLVPEWDNSRAFAAMKTVQEELEMTQEQWKKNFFEGELVFHNGKPT